MPIESSDVQVQLISAPLDIANAIAFVSSSNAGAIDIFLGTTRAEVSGDGHQLLALDYQAYESMAHKQLSELAAQACRRWPIARLVIHHRIGRVPLGEASVLIAVSTPTAQAFEACRWLIDELKKDVTIWKQELWANGPATWVHPENQIPTGSGG